MNLFDLPVPVFSVMDGGPMITGGVVIAEDPEFGINAGIYRLMLKERNITGIDIVTPNNMRKFAERALAKKKAAADIDLHRHPSVRARRVDFQSQSRRQRTDIRRRLAQ